MTTPTENFREYATKGICMDCNKPMPPWTEEVILEQIEDCGDDAQTYCDQCIAECLVGAGWRLESFESNTPGLVEIAKPLIVERDAKALLKNKQLVLLAPLTPKKTSTKRVSYSAKASIEFFERKKIPSYALWCVYIKVKGRYPNTPQGYGAVATLEAAQAEMDLFIDESHTNMDTIRQDHAPRWKNIRPLLISKRKKASKTNTHNRETTTP